ncbi:hypothetical protein [Halomonas sp. SBBP1]
MASGEGFSLFKPGDQVYYAGDVTRQGSNAMLSTRALKSAP